jgi:hypothetical protein
MEESRSKVCSLSTELVCVLNHWQTKCESLNWMWISESSWHHRDMSLGGLHCSRAASLFCCYCRHALGFFIDTCCLLLLAGFMLRRLRNCKETLPLYTLFLYVIIFTFHIDYVWITNIDFEVSREVLITIFVSSWTCSGTSGHIRIL